MIHVGDMLQRKGEEKQRNQDSVALQVVCSLRFKSYMWSKKQCVQREVTTCEYSATRRGKKRRKENKNRLKVSGQESADLHQSVAANSKSSRLETHLPVSEWFVRSRVRLLTSPQEESLKVEATLGK